MFITPFAWNHDAHYRCPIFKSAFFPRACCVWISGGGCKACKKRPGLLLEGWKTGLILEPTDYHLRLRKIRMQIAKQASKQKALDFFCLNPSISWARVISNLETLKSKGWTKTYQNTRHASHAADHTHCVRPTYPYKMVGFITPSVHEKWPFTPHFW